MSSTDELLADVERDRNEERAERSADGHGLRGRIGARLRPNLGGRFRRLFSPGAFLAAFGLSVAGMVLAGMVPLLESLAAVFGALIAGFLLGLLRARRSYLEVALAGAGMAAVAALAQYVVIAAFGHGTTLVAVSGGAGLAAGVVGHYLGRDLRAGLVRDL